MSKREKGQDLATRDGGGERLDHLIFILLVIFIIDPNSSNQLHIIKHSSLNMTPPPER